MPEVCEIPAKTNKLQPVTVSYDAYFGGAMWDGKYIALSQNDEIYQATEQSSGALTIVGSTKLTDTACGEGTALWSFFIVGHRNTPVNRTEGPAILGGESRCPFDLAAWQYPRGGDQAWNIASVEYPIGQSVSIKQ